jgi:hypothetical protein
MNLLHSCIVYACGVSSTGVGRSHCGNSFLWSTPENVRKAATPSYRLQTVRWLTARRFLAGSPCRSFIIQSFKSCLMTSAGKVRFIASRKPLVTTSKERIVFGCRGVPSFLIVVLLSWMNAVRSSSSDLGAAGVGLGWAESSLLRSKRFCSFWPRAPLAMLRSVPTLNHLRLSFS